MGNVRLYGATSGYTELAPPAVAPDGVLTLPSGTGTLLTAEGGKVLQVVRATDTTNRSTTSNAFVDASISVTITPQRSTSKIMLIASFYTETLSSQASSLIALQITDSSNNAISGAQGAQNLISNGNTTSTHIQAITSLFGWDEPNSTSPKTFKVRFAAGTSDTASLYNATQTGQLFAIEVSA